VIMSDALTLPKTHVSLMRIVHRNSCTLNSNELWTSSYIQCLL